MVVRRRVAATRGVMCPPLRSTAADLRIYREDGVKRQSFPLHVEGSGVAWRHVVSTGWHTFHETRDASDDDEQKGPT